MATPLKDWWAPPGEIKYLVEQGTDDQIAPPENGELLKQELGARVTLVSFPGAGRLFIVTMHEKAAADVVSSLHKLGRLHGNAALRDAPAFWSLGAVRYAGRLHS